MTLAEWGNPTALFSYRLKRMSTVEIRAGCRFWVTATGAVLPRHTEIGHSPRRDGRKWLFDRKNVLDAAGVFSVRNYDERDSRTLFPQLSTTPSSTSQDVHSHTGFGTCAKRIPRCKV